MKNKRTLYYISLVAIGITLLGLGIAEKVDSYWSGMGSALACVGALRLLRNYRLSKNDAYREKMEIEINDERNHFLRGKAWAWAGYLFILICGIGVIVFRIVGQNLFSLACSYAVCLMLVLYWVSYLVLKKKY